MPIIFDTYDMPMIVEVWDPWCAHCKQFKPHWDNLTEDPRVKNKVLFLAANCGSRKNKVCKYFPGSETPRIYWYDDPHSEPKPYSGLPLFDEVASFINQQLSGPFIELSYSENFEDVVKEIEKNMENRKRQQCFLFNISRDDDISLEIIKEAAQQVKHLPVTLFLFKDARDNHPPVISIQGRSNEYFVADENHEFNEDNIAQYIKQKSLPFLSIFTDMTLHYSSTNEIAVATLVLPKKKNNVDMRPYAEVLNHYFPTLQTNCDICRSLCNYVNKKADNQGYLVVLNRSQRNYWIYKKELTLDGVDAWAKGILNKTVKPSGPGPSYIGYVLNVYYSFREIGGFPFYILHIPFIILFILILVLLYTIIDSFIFRFRYSHHQKHHKNPRIDKKYE